MMKVYLGYDHRESLAYRIAEYSILTRTNNARLVIKPLKLKLLPMLTRPIEWRQNENGVDQMWCPISEAPMSTEFAVSRFVIPFIERTGWVLGADSDVVCLTDIRNILQYADPEYAVMVVKHKHEPTEKYHDAGQLQSFYQRKNWSSVILWNLDHPGHKRLTLQKLNTWPGRDLHAFNWLEDQEIGELPEEWNYLVGVNEPKDLRKQSLVHYTNGQPCWEKWIPQESDYIFNEEFAKYKKDLCVLD